MVMGFHFAKLQSLQFNFAKLQPAFHFTKLQSMHFVFAKLQSMHFILPSCNLCISFCQAAVYAFHQAKLQSLLLSSPPPISFCQAASFDCLAFVIKRHNVHFVSCGCLLISINILDCMGRLYKKIAGIYVYYCNAINLIHTKCFPHFFSLPLP